MSPGQPPEPLFVAEARTADVGRGMARLDPRDLAVLGLRVGDVVLVRGKGMTPVRVLPAYPEERRPRSVQIDGITRENAGVALGDPVQIETVTPRAATAVRLTTVPGTRRLDPERSLRAVGRALEGLPVMQGDRVRLALLGGRLQEFTVLETNPDGVVIVGADTTIGATAEVAPAKRKAGVTTYEDIGGVRKEILRIRELVELPLKYPELFERVGIDPPKGVLLHGPPGCGKTLIARAVANETDAAFFSVGGPEVIHKFYGESEAHLRAIFEKAAAQAPSIIFIDEIDAIASKREEVRGDQQVERRVVAQLLALMDGLKERGQVVVIGATNIPQVLDPAIRRPGRFDREIAIGVPDRDGRLEILQIHTRGMPLGADVDLQKLADVTHGFVGADLQALCREAAMATLRRVMPQLRLADANLAEEVIAGLGVTAGDFAEALKDVEPSAVREVYTEVPDVHWDDIGGLQDAKNALLEAVVWPLEHPDMFARIGVKSPRGILLSGHPGTGKTLLAKALAGQSGANFISIKGPALLSKWIGESEKAVREVFKKARQASPCIVCFDEIDALAPSRGSGHGSPATDRVISQLLTEMDGIEELRGVTVLGTTNRPDLLDPALVRPGRFDLTIELLPPDARARREIFAIHCRGMPLAADVDMDELARLTEGLTGAEIASICNDAGRAVIREAVGRTAVQPERPEFNNLAVTARHLREAIGRATAACQ